MMNMRRFMGVAATLLLLFTACAPAISKGMKDQVDKNLRFREVFSNPDAFRGRVVMWGGVIIEAKNQKEGTLLEILQKPLDWIGQPEDGDESEGRFLALYEGFLDTARLCQGKGDHGCRGDPGQKGTAHGRGGVFLSPDVG